MFSTFDASSTESNHVRPRPKRNQVSRACDSCRLSRIKCDDAQPCKNCRDRGAPCSNQKRPDGPSITGPQREIQRLRLQVRQLETRLRTGPTTPDTYLTPPESVLRDGSSVSPLESSMPPQEWEGIDIYDARADASVYYGPLSTPFLGARMGLYLADALNSSGSDASHAASIARLSVPPSSTWANPQPSLHGVEDLSRKREEYFLDLLWQSFHCAYPILVEPEFPEYYDSLWVGVDVGKPRRPSPLVDALLAVCMQYGSTFLVGDDPERVTERNQYILTVSQKSDAYFVRSQALLLNEVGNPSLRTLQSYIYCIIYLHNTSRLNASHTLLGTAVRLAQTLRVHIRHDNPQRQRDEFYRRNNWSTLFQLDGQLSMDLGRSPLIKPFDEDNLPGDGPGHSFMSGSMLYSPNDDDINWLSFHVQSVRLTSAVLSVQNAFSTQVADILGKKNAKSIYEDPFIIEELAGILGREVRVVYDWARNVPSSLKIERKGSGEPFSTERTPLNLDMASPLWLQRQKILLELMYHHMQLSNFRTFLHFPPGSSSITSLSGCHSINSLNHAIALTNILHQVLTDTDLLRGWTLVFQYQWDAALCIVGFVLANPVCPSTPAARRCIQTAIQTFKALGAYFLAAAEAAQIVREIGSLAGILVERFHTSLPLCKSEPRDETPVQPDVRAATSTAVQIFATPALTPEYPQSLANHPSFDMPGLDGDLFAGGDVDMGVPIDGSSTGGSTVPTGAGDTIVGMDSWMDGAVLDSLSHFPR
ncbi:hypothetical protein N7492_002005 [Penicillium capsulatum]|uniref:Zn(2)-C6 fungal-type domain-containing protein n=1 Tax=Penicillium capsulatum TaxID=69766 RepID=A0A9W9LV99_9EURO|nr:hypothetical protein N7492_002005 [Penicillium capsulatum]KAJ6123375.1 hypothetical protein N7512_005840 [Penicillium capsulatum]